MIQPNCVVPEKPAVLSNLEILAPSVPKCLIRGREISVYYNRQAAGEWSPHQRPQAEIVLIINPATCQIGWSESEDKWSEQELRGPKICVIAPNLPHYCRLVGETEYLALYVEPKFLRRMVRAKLTGVRMADAAEHHVGVWMLATLLRHLCSSRIRPEMHTIDAIGGELARCLLGLLPERANAAPISGRCLTASQRERVLHFMQTNMKYDIHVVDLAKQTGHSISHFTELFVHTLGCAPYQYLKEIRMYRAYEMLLTGDYLAKEVAVEVGYYNADHFSEVFHRFCGYSPRALLQRVRTGAASSPFSPEERRERFSA
jgi:AraC-like DNA-binding protein